MNYATIKKNDIANGKGVRVSLFVCGCRHHCKGCFNREAWDFDYGEPFTEKTAEEIFCALEPNYIEGLSLLGGEPMEPENRKELLPFLEEFDRRFPNKNLWCYTGFTLEELLDTDASNLLPHIDVLVDGKFIEEQKNHALLFRGSANQRIIDVPRSLKENKVCPLEGKWERMPGNTDIYTE